MKIAAKFIEKEKHKNNFFLWKKGFFFVLFNCLYIEFTIYKFFISI